MTFVQNNLALLLISVAIIIVERIIKYYITEYLRIGESIPVIGNVLMITRVENVGAAFGIFRGQNIVFILAAFIVLFLVIYFYNRIIYDKLLIIATAFIIGGTVGNMTDRLFFNHVIDYIDLSFWPTFNLSDMSLSVGVILLLIYMVRWQKVPEKESIYIHY